MKIVNRKFHRDYEALEMYEVGIVLTGAEVKSIREEKMKLEDAFVKIMGDEVYLINANIAPYSFAVEKGYDARRRRKLLCTARKSCASRPSWGRGGG